MKYVMMGTSSNFGNMFSMAASCHGPEGRGDGPEADIFAERPRNLRDGVLARYDTATLMKRIMDGRALALPLDPAALRSRLRNIDAIETHSAGSRR
jgi:hypothetical protein